MSDVKVTTNHKISTEPAKIQGTYEGSGGNLVTTPFSVFL